MILSAVLTSGFVAMRLSFPLLTLLLATSSAPAFASSPHVMMPPPPVPAGDEPGPNTVSEPAPAPAPAPQPTTQPEPEPEPEAGVGGSFSTDDLKAGNAEPADPGALPAKDRLVYTSILAARYNPLGLEERFWIGWQHRLTDKADPLWKDANFGIFLNPMISPALARVGPMIQIQPLTILRFRATYGWFPWFGNFQYMQSYESPWSEHAPSDLNRGRDSDENYATQGHQVELDLLFQIKVKNIALRNDAQAFWNKMRLQGNDDVFYDIRIDAMVPNGGWSLVNDTDLLFVTDFGLAAGVRGTVTKAFFPDRVYEQGDPREDPNGPMFRMGPMLAYTFFDRPGSKFNKPTVVLIPQWNVVHRYRTGRDVHQAIPTLVLAFGFGGELMRFGGE